MEENWNRLVVVTGYDGKTYVAKSAFKPFEGVTSLLEARELYLQRMPQMQGGNFVGLAVVCLLVPIDNALTPVNIKVKVATHYFPEGKELQRFNALIRQAEAQEQRVSAAQANIVLPS